MYFTSTSTEGKYLAFLIIFVKIVSPVIMWAATVCQTWPRISFKIANIFNWFYYRISFGIDFGFYVGIDFSFYVGIYFVRINTYFVQIRFASRIAIFNCFEIVAITLKQELELKRVHIF